MFELKKKLYSPHSIQQFILTIVNGNCNCFIDQTVKNRTDQKILHIYIFLLSKEQNVSSINKKTKKLL